MVFAVSFLEGLVTFISPCLLPMLPVYLSYFAGGGGSERGRSLRNALGFVLGFSLVFVLMGAFAGGIGGLLVKYRTAVNVISGLIVIAFGLSFLGVLRLNLFKGVGSGFEAGKPGLLSSVMFGVVFSVSWTPCVGAFLGSALMLASQQGSAAQGVLMLLCYSLGLGVPFVLSALLLDRLRGAFDFIKRHYSLIQKICGGFLILIGIMMATGIMGRFLSLLSF